MNTYIYCLAGCNDSKLILLTPLQYHHQTNDFDANWYCPICGGPAEKDDENYEESSSEASA